MPFQVIAVRIADRAEQNCVRRPGHLQRFGRQRMTVVLVGTPADIGLGQFKPGQAKRLQHPHRFASHFGANAVSGEYRNFHLECPPLADPRQPLAQDAARAHNIAVPICKQVALDPLT